MTDLGVFTSKPISTHELVDCVRAYALRIGQRFEKHPTESRVGTFPDLLYIADRTAPEHEIFTEEEAADLESSLGFAQKGYVSIHFKTAGAAVLAEGLAQEIRGGWQGVIDYSGAGGDRGVRPASWPIDLRRCYSGYLGVSHLSEARLEQLANAVKHTGGIDVLGRAIEIEFEGRDTSRAFQRMLVRIARLVDDADGEIRCQIEGDGDQLWFEFYQIRNGRLFRQRGDVVRQAEQEVTEPATIYVRLTDEHVEVYCPVDAEHVEGNRYRILPQPYDKTMETWEFEPGHVVECALEDRSVLVAVRRVP